MKKVAYVLGLVVALYAGFVSAETKVAIVNVGAVLQQMPQREAVAKALDSEFQARVKTIQELEKKAHEASEKLKKDSVVLSSSEKTKLTNTIKDFEEKAQAFNTDYRKRENEEANKLLTKIQQAVIEVSKKNKYDLVLKVEAAFYAADSVDITKAVLEQVKK